MRHDAPEGAGVRRRPIKPSLHIGVGAAHLRALERSTTGRIEYRHRDLLPWQVQPFMGFDLGDDRSHYLFVGVLRTVPVGAHLRLTPSLGIGRFHDGAFTLGHPLEFRSGLELGVRLRGDVEFGAAVHHLSNGGLSAVNPGSEQLFLLVRLPVR